MKKDIIQFLEAVWLSQPLGKYTCVAWKEGELWRQRFPHRDDIERAYQNRGRDLYFCPNLFSRPDRANEYAEPSRWLYADLDEVDPASIPDELSPTLWWETSPGRFQAMWELDKALGRKAHDAVNQRLTYFLNADLNGWPMNKVLRMPGSVSTKWGKPWRIEQGDSNGGISVAKVWSVVRDTKVPSHSSSTKLILSIQDKRKVKTLTSDLPKGCAALLRRRYVQDRSAHVYRLAKSMVEGGMKAEDIALVLSTSSVAQEKYGGRMKEELGRVVTKVAFEGPVADNKHKKTKPKKKEQSLFKVQEMNRFLARTIKPPGWLIGGIWTAEAHGIIAGEEKTYKSMFVQDLAVSVATGSDFLGHFPVPKAKVGPVIYIQEENQESMVQDRFLKICSSRALSKGRLPRKMPLDVINNNGIDLTAKDHLREIERLVQLRGAKMLILDPFYLMTPGVDENSAAEVVPVLKNLLRIKQQYDCGILIVHHYRKQDRNNPMHGETSRISGTGSFGRWYESMLLIERDEADNTVRLYAKHRMSAGEPPVKVEFDMGDMGDPRYEPKVIEAKTEAKKLYDELREEVEAQPGISVAVLAQSHEMTTVRMKRLIDKATHFRLEASPNRSPKVYLRR